MNPYDTTTATLPVENDPDVSNETAAYRDAIDHAHVIRIPEVTDQHWPESDHQV